LGAFAEPKEAGDLRRGRRCFDRQHFDLGTAPFEFQLGEVGRLAGLAMTAGEAVLGETAHRRSSADEGPSAVLDVDQPLSS
jgi:hypothetical protein